MRGATAVLLAVLLAVGCAQDRVIAPVAPGLLALTPQGVAGLAATMEPTAGPSPTPEAVPTRLVAPPEPLSLPPGFDVGVFADDLGPVRMLAVSPDGTLFATVPERNRIVLLPDRDQDGVADRVYVFLQGEPLNMPYGLAFREGWLYVANTDGVLRVPYQAGDMEPRGEAEWLLSLPGEGLHASRSLLFVPDGALYVSVGSSCNACVEEDVRRASILRIEADGERVVRYASGVRNAVGLALGPDASSVWFTDNERDLVAEDWPPDELNLLLPGGDYGWPGCFGPREPAPAAGGDAARCAGTVAPLVEFEARSGPHGMAFYTGDRFPPAYQGGLFVALHGSWSRERPVGYSVAFVPFAGSSPAGPPRPFIEGWLRPDTRRWGSPVDVVQAPDGALLVADDGGGRVYRVVYHGPLGTPTPRFSP